MQPREAPIAGAVRWWQSLRQIVQGGVPAVERAIIGVVTPHVRPNQLLPDATVPGR